jgi:hypothetical protein
MRPASTRLEPISSRHRPAGTDRMPMSNRSFTIRLQVMVEAVRIADRRCLRFREGAVDRGGRSGLTGRLAVEERKRRPRRGVSVAPVHLVRCGGLEVGDGCGLVLVVDGIEPRQCGLLGGLIRRRCPEIGPSGVGEAPFKETFFDEIFESCEEPQAETATAQEMRVAVAANPTVLSLGEYSTLPGVMAACHRGFPARHTWTGGVKHQMKPCQRSVEVGQPSNRM